MQESGQLLGRLECPVYYEDTDLSGFVYHANYLKYFERAREHIIGVSFLRQLFEEGFHFVVSKAKLDYKAPAQHGDIILVESQALYSRSPAIAFDQLAYVLDASGQKRLLVQGEISIVVLNRANRPVRMPDRILKQFSAQNPEAELGFQDNQESRPW